MLRVHLKQWPRDFLRVPREGPRAEIIAFFGFVLPKSADILSVVAKIKTTFSTYDAVLLNQKHE